MKHRSSLNGLPEDLIPRILSWLILLSVGIFYTLTIKDGHDWGGDFSQYILHAKSIVEGESYRNIGYLASSFAFVSPPAYPPVFSLILAPIYYFFGQDLLAFKFVVIATFLFSLLTIGRVFKNDLSTPYLLILLLALGFNPYLWDFKDNILSEYPFLLFSFLSLLLMQYHYSEETNIHSKISTTLLIPLLLGIIMYCAYGTREIGIVLPLTLLTYEIIKFRRLTKTSIISIMVFMILAAVQYYAIEIYSSNNAIQQQLFQFAEDSTLSYPGHLALFEFSFTHILDQVYTYYYFLATFWPTDNLIKDYLFIFINLFALIGYGTRVARKITVLEIYLVGYISVILLFKGNQGLRYLIPILPFLLYYAFIGLQNIRLLRIRHFELFIIIIISTAISSLYLQGYKSNQYNSIKRSVTSPYALDLFEYIQNNTKKDAIFIFRKPRTFSLFTQRSASTYPERKDPDFFLKFMDFIGVDYVITGIYKTDNHIMKNQKIAQHLSPVFKNAEFTVYQYVKTDNTH